jgi:hypothetical protein
MSRRFKWDVWDFDYDGDAYVIAKSECVDRNSVPSFICDKDGISEACKPEMKVEEGWCKFQVRTDWGDHDDSTPCGGYVVERDENFTKRTDGRRKPGWFPVWIVQQGEWY